MQRYIILLLFPASLLACPSRSFPAEVYMAYIAGKVFDANHHLPIPGVYVKLSGSALAKPLYATTPTNGEFHFSDIPPGNGYIVEASLDWFSQDVQTDIRLSSGQKVRLDMVVVYPASGVTLECSYRKRLPKWAAISRAKVIDSENRPLSKVKLTLISEGKTYTAHTNEKGEYRFPARLKFGDVHLTAELEGYVTRTRSFSLDPCENPPRLDFMLLQQ